MANELYNPDKTLKATGKEISAPAKVEPADGAGAAGAAAAEGAEGIVTTDTPDQIEEKRIAAQANMSPAEILADNEAHAESLLTQEQKDTKANEAKIQQEKEAAIITKAEQTVLDKVLKELGVKTIDELKTRIPAKPETDEEKAEREQNLKANVAQFAVKNKMLTMDEITSLENMKNMEKRDLAYLNFAKDYKETHKGRLGEDQKPVPVTEAEIEDSFNDFFHINSENAALKKAGEKQLEQFADTMLSATEAKYKDALETYQEFEAREAFFPVFDNFMKEVVANVPAELSWNIGDNKVVVATDKMDKVAIKKLYTTDAAYDAFYNNKGDQPTRDALQKEFNERLVAKNIDSILAIVLESGKDLGRLEGSDVGAKAPFDEKKAAADADVNKAKPKLTAEESRNNQKKYYSGAERVS